MISGIHFSIAININPPSPSNVSAISRAVLCREHVKTRMIGVCERWEKLLKRSTWR